MHLEAIEETCLISGYSHGADAAVLAAGHGGVRGGGVGHVLYPVLPGLPNRPSPARGSMAVASNPPLMGGGWRKDNVDWGKTPFLTIYTPPHKYILYPPDTFL